MEMRWCCCSLILSVCVALLCEVRPDPPVLTDRGKVRKRENEELSVDMAEPDSHLAFPFPSQVSWTKDGEEVAGGSSTRVFNYSSIFIGSVQPSDSGLYVLSATNYQLNGGPLLGNAAASLTLNVLFGAEFAGPGLETVAVVEGESATLVCGTGLSGNPLPTLTWTDNTGREVVEGGRIALSTGREVASLTLSSTTQNDTGYWNCSAQVYDGANVVGQPVGRDILLVVVVPPVAPVDLSIKGMGATWIYIQWFNPSAGLGNPPLSSHVVRVQEVGGEVEERTFDSSEGEANVTDLLPGTQYTFSVVAVSELNGLKTNSAPSSLANGTTFHTVPAPVCTEVPEVKDSSLKNSDFQEGVGVGFTVGVITTTILFTTIIVVILLILKLKKSAKGKEVTVEANLAYELHRTGLHLGSSNHEQRDPVYEVVGKS